MKTIYSFLFLFSCAITFGQQKYGFEKITPITDVYKTNNYLNLNRIVLDDNNNVYSLNNFKGDVVIGNDTLQSGLSTYINSNGACFYLSKFNSNNTAEKSIVFLKGQNFSVTNLFYSDNYLFIAVSFSDTLFLANDTLISKGNYDCCILKIDKQLNVVSNLKIGSHFGEYISPKAFTLVDGFIYFAANYNQGDTTINVYNNYTLVVDTDTLVCDTAISNSKTEIFLCKMDLNLHPVKIKSMGGSSDQSIYEIDISNNFIYVLGNSSSNYNNIGGVIFNYLNFGYNQYMFLVKLDSNFNGKWVRRISDTHFGNASATNLKVSEGNIIFSGRVITGSGCGIIYPNELLIDNHGIITNNIGEFIYICSYDTAGTYKWSKVSNDNYDLKRYYKNMQTQKLYVTDRSYQGSIIGTDTLNSCGLNDSYVATMNPANGNSTFLASICGNGIDDIDDLTFDKNNKIYVALKSYSDEILYHENYTCYMNSFHTNVLYSSLDSFVVWPTNTNDITKDNILKVYPNPCLDEIHIELNNQNEQYICQILNTMGQIIIESNSNNGIFTIHTADWQKGLYFYTVKNQNSMIHSGNFIKE